MKNEQTKPIPKSLHTVRVLAILAHQGQLAFDTAGVQLDDERAIEWALLQLGYERHTPDDHGLRAKGLAALKAHREKIIEASQPRKAA